MICYLWNPHSPTSDPEQNELLCIPLLKNIKSDKSVCTIFTKKIHCEKLSFTNTGVHVTNNPLIITINLFTSYNFNSSHNIHLHVNGTGFSIETSFDL